MFRRILTVMKKDLRSGLRESIITYLALSPIVLALGFRLLLPLLEDPTVTFAVSADLDEAVVQLFEQHGHALVLEDRAAVIERVLRIDDVPGLVPGADGRPEVILEGSESPWVSAVPGIVLDAASAGTPVEIAFESLEAGPTRLRGILTAVLTFCILLMGGVAVGFLILEEKEHGTLRAFTVSPVRFGEYLAAKVLGASVMGLVLGWVAAAIMLGGQVSPGPLIVASIGALPAALLLGFIVATVAQDQIAAIAVLKSLLFFFTSLPLAGFFVTGGWLTLLGLFTNHWAIQALYLAVQPDPTVPWKELLGSLATGLPLVVLVAAAMRRRLGFSGEGAMSARQAPSTPEPAAAEAA